MQDCRALATLVHTFYERFGQRLTQAGAALATWEGMGGLKRRLALGYNRLVATRLGRAAMRAVGPLFHIVATRDDGPPPTQPPLRETTP